MIGIVQPSTLCPLSVPVKMSPPPRRTAEKPFRSNWSSGSVFRALSEDVSLNFVLMYRKNILFQYIVVSILGQRRIEILKYR